MRELEERRQQGIDMLTGDFARGRISTEGFEQFVADLQSAPSIAEVDGVLVRAGVVSTAPRMVSPTIAGPASVSGSAEGYPSNNVQINAGHVPDRHLKLAVFSGSETRGNARVARHTVAAAVFGGVKMDLRNASFPPGESVIDANAAFGGVEITLPRGIGLTVNGIGLFGGYSHPRDDGSQPVSPDAPYLTIRGLAVFGGVEVKYADPLE